MSVRKRANIALVENLSTDSDFIAIVNDDRSSSFKGGWGNDQNSQHQYILTLWNYAKLDPSSTKYTIPNVVNLPNIADKIYSAVLTSRCLCLAIRKMQTHDSANSVITVLCATKDHLEVWKLEHFTLSTNVSLLINHEIAASNLFYSICINHQSDQKIACHEGKYVIIRDERLAAITSINISSSNSNNKQKSLCLTFAGTHEEFVIGCFEDGSITGWSIDNGNIVISLQFPVSLTSFPTVMTIINPQDLCTISYKNRKINNGLMTHNNTANESKEIFYILIAFHDSRLKLIQVTPDNKSSLLCRECSEMDLNRQSRFFAAKSNSIHGFPSSSSLSGLTNDILLDSTLPGSSSAKNNLLIPLNLFIVPSYLSFSNNNNGTNNTNNINSNKNSIIASTPLDGLHLLFATISSIIVIEIKTFQIISIISFDSLEINNITSISVSVTHALFDIHTPSNGQHSINLLMTTSFEREVKIYTIPVISNARYDYGKSNNDNSRLNESQMFEEYCKINDNNNNDNVKHLDINNNLYMKYKEDAKEIADNNNNNNNSTRSKWDIPQRHSEDNSILGTPYAEKKSSKNISSVSSKINNQAIIKENTNNNTYNSKVSIFDDPSVPLSLFITAEFLRLDETLYDNYDDDDGNNDGNQTNIDSSSKTRGGKQRSLLEYVIKTSETPVIHQGAMGKDKGKLLPSRGDWEAPRRDKNGHIIDQPVTFHSRIKSSGYGEAFNKKSTSQMRSSSAPRYRNTTQNNNNNNNKGVVKTGKRLRRYPIDCGLMTTHQPHNDFPYIQTNGNNIRTAIPTVMNGPISSITFSDDASLLGVVSLDTTVSTIKLPVSKWNGEGIYYMGHNGLINSITFSHSKPNKEQMILSSSSDHTARLWKGSRVDTAAVVFSTLIQQSSNDTLGISSKSGDSTVSRKSSTIITPNRSNASSKSNSNSNSSQRNKPYGAEVNHAKFFYQDKFVLMTVKASVLMYSYEIDTADNKNDLKRLQSLGRYRLVHEWKMTPAQSVSTMTCINTVQSPIIMCATSDRNLSILDAATGSIVRQLESQHDKSIHCIALPQPSIYVPLSPDHYNIFTTSSIDNSIRLWDLRAPITIARYTNHVNKREPVSCCISPCLQYLATGSED
eukprot:gene14563-19551_t